MFGWLTTGEAVTLKVNDANHRFVIEKLYFNGTSGSLGFSSKTYPLVGDANLCDSPIPKGENLVLTCTTGTLFYRVRQEQNG